MSTLFLIVLCNQKNFAQDYLIQNYKKTVFETGWIQIHTASPVAKVWIDSLEIPLAGSDVIELSAGIHVFHFRAIDPENWLLQDVVDTIKIVANDTLNYILSFPEYQMINSDPYGANVWINGKLLGQTPLLVSKQDLLENQIVISKEMYEDTTLFRINKLSPALWIELKLDSGSQLKKAQLAKLKLKGRNKQKYLALLTFGASLASGSASLYFKRNADREYNNYRRAGNPDDIRLFYDRTEKYDRLAAATYIGFELNLIASTYSFFKYVLNRE